MAVGEASTDFKVVPGVRLASVPCGIKGQDELDLVLFEFEPGSVTAGIFTQSHFAGAPVQVGRRHLEQKDSRFFLINSGNANAATGEEGRTDAEACCHAVSQRTGALPEEVIPFSTGVIGEKLQVANITDALPELYGSLNETNWLLAAQGIMTTDTRPKIASRQIEIDGELITMTGIAKGAGMIQPNMATMLSFVTTDLEVEKEFLQQTLREVADISYNMCTIDGDSSTNDIVVVLANGLAGNDPVSAGSPGANIFKEALMEACIHLSREIARDGEGATRLIIVEVAGAASIQDARISARTVASSNLVKSAVYGADPNWGRVLMALGRSGARVEESKVDLFVNGVCIMQSGLPIPFHRDAVVALMRGAEVTFRLQLNLGEGEATAWGCDLTEEYVIINSAYTT